MIRWLPKDRSRWTHGFARSFVPMTVVIWLLMTSSVLASDGHWQRLRPGGRAPQALQWAAQAHDLLRNQLLVFGGTDQLAAYNDLWLLDLTSDSWSSVRPRGTLPYYRQQASMAYAAPADRAVVFGGYFLDAGRPTYYDDTWFLELSGTRGPEWSKLPFSPRKPEPRRDASLVYQPSSGEAGRMILFGGWNHVSRTGYNDVWALDLTPGSEHWTEIGSHCSGGPVPRDAHVARYDPLNQRMLVFGGWLRSRSTYRTTDELWAFDLSGRGECWMELKPPTPKPPPLAWSTLVFESCPTRRRMLLFGGFQGTGSSSGIRGSDSNEVWSLEMSVAGEEAWTQLDPQGARPSPRDAHVAALDPEGDRMLVYAGWENEGELLRDVWALELPSCELPAPQRTITATPTESPTVAVASTATPTLSPTVEPTPSALPSATIAHTPSATPDEIATAVVATLTAMAPTASASITPDRVATAVAATLTAAAPSPSPTLTPDVVGTAVAATLRAETPTQSSRLHLPWLSRLELLQRSPRSETEVPDDFGE